MNRHAQFYIGGRWLEPAIPAALDVIDPSTEQPFTQIAVGSKEDVDRAVAAARAAFEGFSRTTREERLALLRRLLENYNSRAEELAQAVSQEMGAPLPFAREAQVWAGRVHLEATIEALETYEFSRLRGTSLIVKEPIGVAALITPWNWPLNQIVCKVAPALAAGCTVVLKPSEIAPISGILFAEIIEASAAPSRRLQSRQRHGSGGRAGHGGASRRRHGVLHRIDPRRDHRRQGGGRHGQAGRAGARRQVAEHHPAGRGFSGRGASGGPRLLRQQRAVVRRSDQNAGPGRKARRGARNRRRSRGRAEGRRSARARDRPRTGRKQDPVRQDPASHRGRNPGGSQARRRRARTPAWPEPRILRPADRLRRREARA